MTARRRTAPGSPATRCRQPPPPATRRGPAPRRGGRERAHRRGPAPRRCRCPTTRTRGSIPAASTWRAPRLRRRRGRPPPRSRVRRAARPRARRQAGGPRRRLDWRPRRRGRLGEAHPDADNPVPRGRGRVRQPGGQRGKCPQSGIEPWERAESAPRRRRAPRRPRHEPAQQLGAARVDRQHHLLTADILSGGTAGTTRRG